MRVKSAHSKDRSQGLLPGAGCPNSADLSFYWVEQSAEYATKVGLDTLKIAIACYTGAYVSYIIRWYDGDAERRFGLMHNYELARTFTYLKGNRGGGRHAGCSN